MYFIACVFGATQIDGPVSDQTPSGTIGVWYEQTWHTGVGKYLG
jgi:hypothetical protein